MRRIGWLRAAVLMGAALGLPTLGAAGCSAEDDVEPAKGLMLAIRTDMSIPEDVAVMRIEVLTNGVAKLLSEYNLGPAPEKTTLPGTLALLPPSDPKLPVKIRIVARTKSGKATIMREVTTTVPNDRLVMLPIGIQWLCWDSVIEDKADPNNPSFANKQCKPDEETCISGGCVPQKVDSTTLAPYNPTQIFGGAKAAGSKGQCFDTVSCFSAGKGEVPDASCTLAAPPVGEADKYNVALVLPQGGGAGICGDSSCLIPLERDDIEGWKIEGGRVKLPPSVCQKLGSSVVAVATSTTCTTKTSALPTCGPWSSVTSISGTFDGGGPELDGAIANDVVTDGAFDGGSEAGEDVSADSPGKDASPDSSKQDGSPDASLDAGPDVQDATFEAPPASTNLGQKCTSKSACGPLDCLDVSSTALFGEGPAGGMCTLPCAGFPPNYCSLIEAGAICQSFGPGADYCLKGCAQGPVTADAGFDPNKCFGRSDMGCAQLFSGSGPVQACLPTCKGTQDCDVSGSTNTACNLASGLCTKLAPQGAPYGTSCGFGDAGVPIDAGLDAAPVDASPPPQCEGLCSPVLDPSTPGLPGTFVCSGGCVVNPDASCGWSGAGTAQAACMKNFVPNAADLGDLGQCVELCDCQDFCSDPNMVCTLNPDSNLASKWGQMGYCTYKLTSDGGTPAGLGC